jgi:phage tail protein X
MMVSLSAVLFVIAFIMGAGLIQSDGRLGAVEDDMASLNNAYNYVLTQLSQLQTQAVFAASDNRVPDNSVIDNNLPDNGVSSSNVSNATPGGGLSDNTEPDEGVQNDGGYDNQASDSGNQADGDDDDAQLYQAARTPRPEPQQTPDPATPTPMPRTTGTPLPLPGNDGTNIELPTATIPPSLPPVTIPPSTPASNSNSQSNGVQAVFGDDLSNYDTYTVQRGDNLSTICYRYYGTTDMLEKVMEVNNIAQPDMIYYGKVLLMPKIDDTGEPQ